MNKRPEETMTINVENIDEIRWSISNGHLTIQTLNKGYRSAHIEPINHMKAPVRATMGLLELCASEMDKGVKRKSGRYPWEHDDFVTTNPFGVGKSKLDPCKQKRVCKDCGAPMKEYAEPGLDTNTIYLKCPVCGYSEIDKFRCVETTNPFIFGVGSSDKDIASVIKKISREIGESMGVQVTLEEIRDGVGVTQEIPRNVEGQLGRTNQDVNILPDPYTIGTPWRYKMDVIIDRLSSKGLSATDISEVFDGIITDNERYKLRCVECGQVAKCVCGSKRFKSVKESEDEPKKTVWRLDVYDEYEGWRNALGWYPTKEKAEKEMQENIDQWDPERLAQTTIQWEVYEVEVD